jgi:hypothetical protein
VRDQQLGESETRVAVKDAATESRTGSASGLNWICRMAISVSLANFPLYDSGEFVCPNWTESLETPQSGEANPVCAECRVTIGTNRIAESAAPGFPTIDQWVALVFGCYRSSEVKRSTMDNGIILRRKYAGGSRISFGTLQGLETGGGRPRLFQGIGPNPRKPDLVAHADSLLSRNKLALLSKHKYWY